MISTLMQSSDDYAYVLPEELIAQSPANKRSASRLLIVPRLGGPLIDSKFSDLATRLGPTDLLVINETKVLPARLYGYKTGTGGKFELLLERLYGGTRALVQIRASKAPGAGTELTTAGGTRLRILGREGMFFVVATLIYFGIIEGLKSPELKQRLVGINTTIPKPAPTFVITTIAIIILSISGLYYSWNWLTPMLLEYLTNDAQSAGLSTEWRLSGYVGFITNLAIASIIGFQAPVATLLILRFGVVDRSQIKLYRRHIWFASFVMGALFSPPDPLSLFLVAVPVILLFEIALIIDTFTREQ